MKRILLITITLFCAVSVFSQNIDLQPAATLRLTREEPITVRQLRTEIDRLQAASGQTIPPERRKEFLDGMIDERLILQAAARDRVTITENEINQQLQPLRNALAQQLGRMPTDAEFAEAVRNDFNMDVASFREQIQRRNLIQKYLIQKKQPLFQAITAPTDQEIREQYNLRRAQLIRPETVRFTMIMIPYGQDAASRTTARQTADRLHRDIGSNPSKFDEIVMTPSQQYRAGDVGYIPRTPEARNALGPALLEAAFSTRQGQVSSVIEGLEGFCIIKVTENHSQKQLELDDLVQLGTRQTVRQTIGEGMLAERQQAVFLQALKELSEELRAQSTVRIFENNLNW